MDFQILRDLIDQPILKKFIFVVFLFSLTPSLTSTFEFYYTVELNFDLSTMSNIGFMAALGYFLSVIALNLIFSETSVKELFISTGMLIILLNLSSVFLLLKYIHLMRISTVLFCNLLNTLLVFVKELNFIPLMSLCSRMCPTDLEATTYGFFTCIFSFGNYLASIFASLLLLAFGITSKDYSKLWVVVIIQVLYGLSILISLGFTKFPIPDQIYSEGNRAAYDADRELLHPRKRKKDMNQTLENESLMDLE